MDASQSPAPSEEGSQPRVNGADAPGPDDTNQSFLRGLLRFASDAFSAPDGDEHGDADEMHARLAGLGAAERAMVANILRLSELRVVDVMTPRADIIAVSGTASLEEVMQAFEQGQLSRLPVYGETLDDPRGFVHLKDLALCYGVGRACDPATFSLERHLHDALFVPPSMRIAALLQKMQAGRVHMALVIDEFGGVDGLVTIEDLLEQVVGEIEDEHDVAELRQWRREAPGVYLADARADIREFEEAEGAVLLSGDWDEEVDTLGGLVFMLSGRVPTRGEVITHPLGHEFEITDADPRRIRRLRVRIAGAGAEAGTPALGAAAE